MNIREFIKEDTKFIAREGFMIREIAGETVLVATGKTAETFHGMVSLNETSTVVWKALSNPHTIDELVNILNDLYDIPSIEIVKESILSFILKGIENQLIFIVKE